MDSIEFRKRLLLSYLNDVAILDNSIEFQKFFPEIEGCLKTAISESNDLNFLNKVKRVISYKMNNIKTK